MSVVMKNGGKSIRLDLYVLGRSSSDVVPLVSQRLLPAYGRIVSRSNSLETSNKMKPGGGGVGTGSGHALNWCSGAEPMSVQQWQSTKSF